MDNLITTYQQLLNLQNATFSRIDHENGIVAVVYKVTLISSIQYVLKICPRSKDYLNELYFLKRFSNILRVPQVLQVIQPEEDISGAILMEHLPGALLQIADFNDSLLHEIGSQLALIHLNREIGYGDLTQPKDLSSDPKVYFSLKFEEIINECSNHLPKALIEKSHRYYDTHLHLLNSVDGPCLTHRDFRPGNLIVKDGKLQGIIDWSAGRAGFAEEDFCPIEHGEWLITPTSKRSFFEGYSNIRPVPDYNHIMPLLRLCRALNVIGFTVKNDSWKDRNAKIYDFNQQFLSGFLNK